MVAACGLHVPAVPAAQQDTDESGLYRNVLDAAALYEELVNTEYAAKIKQLEADIASHSWNYSYTMGTLLDKSDIYDGINMDEMVAALCMIAGNNTKTNITMVETIFLGEEEQMTECFVPVKRQQYKELPDGNYEEDGICYICEPGYYDTYVLLEDGSYQKGEPEYIEPDKKQIIYADVTLRMYTAEELLERNGYQNGTYEEELERRVRAIRQSGIDENLINQTVFVKSMLEESWITQEQKEILAGQLSYTTTNRQSVAATAASLIGKVPYLWGGKSKKAGYDTSWWTYRDKKQNGLDCSGFVQWVFRSAGFSEEVWEKLISTGEILRTCEEIEEADLCVGDLGLLNYGETTNHVGIYAGDGYWIHCSSTTNTVVMDQFQFHVYMRVAEIDDEILQEMEEKPLESIAYSEEELQLLAQYVWKERRGEGVNGWIACAEQIKRQVERKEANDITEALKEAGVTADSKEMTEELSEDVIRITKMVLEGYTSILGDTDNEDVLREHQ